MLRPIMSAGGIAEDPLGSLVEIADQAGLVDRQDRIGGGIQDHFQAPLAFADLRLLLAQTGDVGLDADDAAVLRPALGDAQVPSIGKAQFDRVVRRVAVGVQPVRDPTLRIVAGIDVSDLAACDTGPQDLLERHAKRRRE